MSETRRTSWTDLINRICPSRDETSLAAEAGNVSVVLNRAVTVRCTVGQYESVTAAK